MRSASTWRPARKRRSTLLSHATRRHTRIQPSAPLGWKIDDVELAVRRRTPAGMSSSPAGSDPQLANRMLCTFAECRRRPCTWYMMRNGLAFGERARRTVDVGDPADALLEVAARVRDHRGVQAHAAHHDERALLARAVGAADRGEADVDRVRVAVEGRAHHRLRDRSSGSSRLRASRLPVPLGTIVSGTPLPLIASATARTVPSPPATSTASAPSSSACRVTPSPRSSTVVS